MKIKIENIKSETIPEIMKEIENNEYLLNEAKDYAIFGHIGLADAIEGIASHFYNCDTDFEYDCDECFEHYDQ